MMPLNIFIGFSTLDFEYFKISKIKDHLKRYSEIGNIFFWEKNEGLDLVEYIESTLPKCQVFILFCSENSKKSKAVEGDWMAAYQLQKKGLIKIIPVYENEKYIPTLLLPLLCIKFKRDNHKFLEDLYKKIVESQVLEEISQEKLESDKIINEIFKFAQIYSEITLIRLAEKIGIETKRLETLIENLIFKRKLRAHIRGDTLVIEKELSNELNSLETYKKLFSQMMSQLNINNLTYREQTEVSNILEFESEIYSKQIEKPYKIFFSYALKDSEMFQIEEIAKNLREYVEIEEVLFCEESVRDDFIKYMEDYIGKCDIFILFCSKNALESYYVGLEWRAALSLVKRIIPIFIDKKHIPNLLSSKLGIKFNKDNLDSTIRGIFDLILKKLIVKPKGEHKTKVKGKHKVIHFRGTNVIDLDANVIKDIEHFTNGRFIHINNIKVFNDFGFTVNNRRVTGIRINFSRIKTLPKSIGNLDALIYLFLNNNNLTTLPEAIINLKSLQYINLSYNPLAEEPDERTLKILGILEHKGVTIKKEEILEESIYKAPMHEKVSFRGTQVFREDAVILQEVESQISKELIYVNNIFETIETSFTVKNHGIAGISLFNIKLESFPESLTKLIDLERLDLSGNNISHIPNTIKRLGSLKELRYNNNYLTILSEHIGYLRSLEKLYLNNNQLDFLPKSIINLKSLKELHLNGNKIKNYPYPINTLKNLEFLDLSNNSITTLPKSINKLSSLKEIRLENNPLVKNMDVKTNVIIIDLKKRIKVLLGT